jgi:hypothetical protein
VRASSNTFGWRKRVSGPERLWRPRAYVQSLAGVAGWTPGCGGGEPRVAVVGYAFPLWGTTTVQVARDEIASWTPGSSLIRIVYDSLTQGDPPDVEVMRAQRPAVRGYLEALGRTRSPYRGVTGDITFLPGRAPRLVMARLRGGRLERVGGP